MSHDYHQGPDDAILFDNCGECTERAANPLYALLNLDEERFRRLTDRVRKVEFTGGLEGAGAETYRTHNEMLVGRALYNVLLLLQRHPDLAVPR